MALAEGLPVPEKTRILLVDDEASVLKLIKRRLESAGHDVTACGGGAEALALLAEHAFDVMVSDIQMPGVSGLNLLRAVREHDLDLPVVLVTGDPGVDTATNAVEYGAFRYLIKPIPFEELDAVVTRAANVGQMARSKREYIEEFGSGKFRVGDRAGIDAMLDRALSSLWMAYQPIVRASDSSLFAYEALMRVDEPMLPHPGAVLDAAERAGRIHDVGRAVRNNVVATTRGADERWMFFVNLHPEDLLDASLFLKDSPFAALAKHTVLEITERMSLDRVSDVQERVALLRELGFKIALDDLGAGYAGLSSFTLLEPEFVKLDMSLVRDIHQTPTKQKIVRSMVSLCHDMGKQIIAEGVENKAERDAVVDLGCDLLQGYLLARPGKPFPALAV
jgi:EAL domain-containing protein (putative c-di-GMP-specific phosphodiesterase class I)/ActR/RegA family two-component response regulator